MKTCSEEGCDRPYSAKGLCKPHYERVAYLAQRTERIASAKARYEANREDIGRARRQAKYGITDGEYESLSALQSHVCAICSAAPKGRKTRLCIDHCHDSGRIRGLLCDACNRGIGLLGDDPRRLAAALVYLARDGVPQTP
jgi:hypothetical protein